MSRRATSPNGPYAYCAVVDPVFQTADTRWRPSYPIWRTPLASLMLATLPSGSYAYWHGVDAPLGIVSLPPLLKVTIGVTLTLQSRSGSAMLGTNERNFCATASVIDRRLPIASYA